jgi:hypothetical protein
MTQLDPLTPSPTNRRWTLKTLAIKFGFGKNRAAKERMRRMIIKMEKDRAVKILYKGTFTNSSLFTTDEILFTCAPEFFQKQDRTANDRIKRIEHTVSALQKQLELHLERHD